MRQSDAKYLWGSNLEGPYQQWRTAKLQGLAQIVDPDRRVEIRDMANISAPERAELVRRCSAQNAVFYASNGDNADGDQVQKRLRDFVLSMGLQIAEIHRSADKDGVVALRQSQATEQRGYIPYSNKPMNWHTDGYYNSADQKIRAMVLHCVQPASDGGVNQFLDPEIAYMRLRDENPAFVVALMRAETMTIPENREGNGKVRAASIGPVFSVDAMSGNLEMRYTARTRSIVWQADEMTSRAVAFLNSVLKSDDPYIQTTKMAAGEGVLCNNSLHNRTGFDTEPNLNSDRLIYRMRFHNRVSGS